MQLHGFETLNILLLYPLLKIQSVSHAALEVKCG